MAPGEPCPGFTGNRGPKYFSRGLPVKPLTQVMHNALVNLSGLGRTASNNMAGYVTNCFIDKKIDEQKMTKAAEVAAGGRVAACSPTLSTLLSTGSGDNPLSPLDTGTWNQPLKRLPSTPGVRSAIMPGFGHPAANRSCE